MKSILNKFIASKRKGSIFLGTGIIIVLFIFVLLPIVTMFSNLNHADFAYVFSNQKFLNSVFNSVIYSLIGASTAVILATLAAYFLSNSNIKNKSLFALILTLPMLIPTLSIGLGIRNTFGANGIIHQFFGIFSLFFLIVYYIL